VPGDGSTHRPGNTFSASHCRPGGITQAAIEHRFHQRIGRRDSAIADDHEGRAWRCRDATGRNLPSVDDLGLELRAHRRIDLASEPVDFMARSRASNASPPMKVPPIPRI